MFDKPVDLFQSSQKIPCDGCERIYASGEMQFVHDVNHECRYCRDCSGIYAQWLVTAQAEEARRQREYDLWQLEQRQHLPLKRMPTDFPPVVRRPEDLRLRLG